MGNEIPIGQLLLRAFEWFDDGLMNELAAAGWPRQNRTQSLLFANLDRSGTRPSVLAGRLGVTRQAVHQTVVALEESGLVTLQRDPSSGRSKLVMLTPLGERIVADAREAFQRLEEKLADRIGKREVDHLRRALERDWGTPSRPSAD
jgi:DNA-binding MarR family transcriptional regulator